MPRGWFVLAFVLAGVSAAWFTLFELRPYETEERFTGEAAVNQFLAARRILRRMGVEANTVHRLGAEALDEIAGHTVIVAQVAPSDMPRVAGRFAGWIADGGHLTVALSDWVWVEDENEVDDEVDAEGWFDTEQPQPAPWLGQWSDIEQGLGITSVSSGVLRTATVHWPAAAGEPAPEFEVSTHSPYYLNASGAWEFGGACAVRRRVGAGSITVLCGSAFLTNSQIQSLDHARLLWSLVQSTATPGGTPSSVWLVTSIDYPGIMDWLRHNLPYAIVGASVCLGLWVWMVSRRFGPITQTRAPGRRNVIEQVDAAARFVWRHGTRAALLEPILDEVERHAARHVPGFRGLDAHAQAQALVTLVGPAGNEAAALLQDRSAAQSRARPGVLLRDIRVLEEVRRKL